MLVLVILQTLQIHILVILQLLLDQEDILMESFLTELLQRLELLEMLTVNLIAIAEILITFLIQEYVLLVPLFYRQQQHQHILLPL